MKKKLLILLSVCFFILPQLHSQEIFALGGEDNYSNLNRFIPIIKNKLDSAFASKNDMCCGKMYVIFTIGITGKIDSCRIENSFNVDADTLVLNTMKQLDFKEAAVFSYGGIPISMRFSMPIKLDTTTNSIKKKRFILKD